MMKKLISGLSFLIVVSVMLGLPSLVLGEEAEMDSQVGIHFDNDYTPSSEPEELPDPPAKELPGTGGTKKPMRVSLPQTGEQSHLGTSVIGLIMIGSISLFYRKRSI